MLIKYKGRKHCTAEEQRKINVRIPLSTYLWLKERNENISQEVNAALNEFKCNRSFDGFDESDIQVVEELFNLKMLCTQLIARKNKRIKEFSIRNSNNIDERALAYITGNEFLLCDMDN